MSTKNGTPSPGARAILSAACSVYGITRAELLTGDRRRSFAEARAVVASLIRDSEPQLSLPEIGGLLGGRDHTSVLTMVRRIRVRSEHDEALRGRIERVRVAVRRDGPATGRVHDLKCWEGPFEDAARGAQRCQVRRDDRGYEVGDELLLREFRADDAGAEATTRGNGNSARGTYTGRTLRLRVTHLVRGPFLGLAEGWVVLSVERIGT